MASLVGCCAMEICQCAGCFACSCCTSLVSASLTQAARFGHVLVILLTFTFAIVLGQYYPDKLNGYSSDIAQIDLVSGCAEDYQNSCMYRQLIYRASLALFILFFMLACTSFMSDYVNKGLWVPKFMFAFVLFIAFWWGDNSFFTGYSEFARVISFFWMLVQALLLLDFAHDIHEVMMAMVDKADAEGGDSRGIYGTYLFLALGCLTASGVGLAYLFKDYAGCETGMAFTVITLLMGVLTTIVSLLDVVNRGLLTPSVMFAYSVFVCWYAMLSSNDSSCNPYALDNQGPQTGATVTICIITIAILLYCVGNGTKILNIFYPEGEGVVKSTYGATTAPVAKTAELNSILTGSEVKPAGDPPSKASGSDGSGGSSGSTDNASSEPVEPPAERAFFHVLMMLVSIYGAMVLTAWGQANGNPQGVTHSRSSAESLWLKIVSQWVFLLLYCKVLHVAYNDREL